MILYFYFDSPIGKLLLLGKDGIVEELHFPNSTKLQTPDKGLEDEQSFKQVIRQLNEYFQGKRKRFDLKLSPAGTPFQKSVWQQLQNIPFGQTVSYSFIAEKIGNPKASRAVGMANNKNPIPIIIPCHRVLGKDGSLTGYGGGLDTKRFLLDLEGYK